MRGLGYIGCAGVSCVTLPAWIGYDVVPWYIGLSPVAVAAVMFLVFWCGIGLDYLDKRRYYEKRRKRNLKQ